ncbi:LacI family DNA-binding transcriptional regulator [Lacisediminihabitans changchengi]|uniref:LacI family DNA-binding transcriptional regulator n=1 Tax=Lacisediminihabitans changchengi TaxID=2787634 RepID=A0A934VZ57_9MICO|nr:LacI family DNA-binding transcriptional regulator [Lacisediminihabitans changchengi]MBK4348782.1 LacI family DNA-binding transcriptional regulator [Lacisediminihabitans changchengi]
MPNDDRRPRRATIHDVVSESGVSRGTVSRVLNDERYVSAEARIAVEAAVAKVGYVRNTAARNLKSQRSRAIGLVVHEPHSVFLEDPNIGAILLGTNTVLSEADYQLVSLVVDSDRDSARVAEYLSGGFVDGVVIISARAADPIARAVAKLGIPAAFVGHPPEISGIPWVGIDNRAAARAITARLIATGRRRVGMIVSALDRDSGRDRLAGFRDALGDAFDPGLVVDYPLYAYRSGSDGMAELLRRSPDIDGVFAASDAIAAGAMDWLRGTNKAVPLDIGVVGFDDSAWALRCQPLLSTVRQPADELGRRAAESVLSQIQGAVPGEGGIMLDTAIVWRDSA